MQYRTLGKTGLTISEVGFGCIPIIRLETSQAVKTLRHAYDRGITFYDTANAYRDSEDKIGRAFSGMRDKIVIATKTGRRDGAGALEHLENSLRMLQTEYIDLYQLHQVSREQDWEVATAAGGALEVVTKAQEQGKIRHIGVTSHSLSMALRLVKTGLFSTVQFPFNFIEDAAKDDLRELAIKMSIGFIVMKPFAGGMIDNATIAFKFLRQFPEMLPIPGFDSPEAVDEILAFYNEVNTVTDDDLVLMDKYRDELGKQFCRRCEYCQPCPHGVSITPAMGYQVIARRMSPAVAVDFARPAMESVEQCVECGECLSRCPYDLPIPEMLKKHYSMYKNHLASTK
ncbi:aldo/keto reductase [Sporomusa sp.]|uniref:aldo/keto reductase n=1 Tax=Sporomusa sp. TaxID=2078658 RepID=UPI002C2087C2|nr:aldo/keto reductase [Sporomusa sp.]HWR45724.1 aldo/keto reductase [Sporomusa sp.]